jgi:hypothetical protein
MSFREKRFTPLTYLESPPRFGLVQAQPADIYSFYSAKISGRSASLSVPTAIILIWNGIHSRSSLLPTTGYPSPLVTVLNPSLHLPATYHIGAESEPAQPRHVC